MWFTHSTLFGVEFSKRHVYKLNVVDILTQKHFEDGIGRGSHPIDIYPLPKEIEEIPPVDEFYFEIPYSCLLPEKVSNLLIAGRCVSATREASGCIRPTATCMVIGEAAGTAAAILCKDGTNKAKDVDIQKLRTTLKENGVVL